MAVDRRAFAELKTSTKLICCAAASSLLLAALGCATTGGASQSSASSPLFTQSKAEFIDAAIAQREAGDPEGALALWAKGLRKVYEQDKVSAKSHPSHAEFASALSEEWTNLQPLLDAKVNAALKAGKPYEALRLVMRAQYTNGLPNGAPPKAVFSNFAPEMGRWHMQGLAMIKGSRSPSKEAAVAASAGYHALASCLYAGIGDKPRRDAQIALRDRPLTSQTLSLLVTGDIEPVTEVFMAELEKRYEVIARAEERIVMSLDDVKTSLLKPRTYRGLSKETLNVNKRDLLAYLDAHEALTSYYPPCASGDMSSCLEGYVHAGDSCVVGTGSVHCQVAHQPQLIKDYRFWAKTLQRDVENQREGARIWSAGGDAYTTPARYHVVGDVGMTFSKGADELSSTTLRVGVIRDGDEAAAQRAFGEALVKRAFVVIPEAFGHTNTLAAWDAEPGFSSAQADAYVRDFVNRLNKHQEIRVVDQEFLAKLCYFKDGYHSPTSFYTTLNVPM